MTMKLKIVCNVLIMMAVLLLCDSGNSNHQVSQPSTSSIIKPKTNLVCVAYKVHDGDTFNCKNENGFDSRIRLFGVDAPELTQEFGKQSTEYLSNLILNRNLELVIKGQSYDRKVCFVVIHDNQEFVNINLINAGMAWVDIRYCKDKTWQEYENQAIENKKGLWSSWQPIPPWNYRKKTNNVDE